MKTKLLFKSHQLYTLLSVLLICLCFNSVSAQTNLLFNSTMDEFQTTTNDNSDAWDMSPPSTVTTDQDAIDGTTTPSPYRRRADNPDGWNNSDLDAWLNTNCGDSNEAPGSSSDGNYDYSAGPDAGVPTRGIKINEACRRLYQYVPVTAGVSYTLSLQSRSEAENVPTEVYILNTEIVDEVGFDNTSTTVDAFLEITNDFSSSKSNATTDNFTQTTLEFTPSGSFIVIYITSPLAVDASTEVFFDNIEMYETSTLSVNDLSTSTLKVYPNPANTSITIKSSTQNQIDSVELYNILGSKVIASSELINDSLDISQISAGVYLLKINAGTNSITKRIIIE